MQNNLTSGPSSLPNLDTGTPAALQLSNLALLAHQSATQPPQQLVNPLAHMVNSQSLHLTPQGQVPVQTYPVPPPQVNTINLIPPSYSPQVATYQQSSPTPKEPSLIDFD